MIGGALVFDAAKCRECIFAGSPSPLMGKGDCGCDIERLDLSCRELLLLWEGESQQFWAVQSVANGHHNKLLAFVLVADWGAGGACV